MERTSIPRNNVEEVKWVFGAYEDAGVGLANGFQKDAIQNSIGARPDKSWNGFKCEIKCISTEKGDFLIVEDSGTVGLTGENIGAKKIDELSNTEGYTFPSTERLSRFSSMNNSGGNAVGGGLYGVGKVVYTVASDSYSYYFDSLTKDGKYVANSNEKGRIYDFAYEGQEAKDFIKTETGLDPKESVGTRVIIISPKQEIIDSINDGSMEKFVQESYWKTIEKMPKSSGIFINGKKVEIPEWLKNCYLKTEPKNKTVSPGYRVKNAGLYLYKDGSNEWNTVSYYRKGMKIGEIDLSEVPDDAAGKFWGFIEVDEPWEKELELIEDKVHFGVSKYKKNKNAYQFLRSFANDAFRQFMIDAGYIKEHKKQEDDINKELNEMAKEILDDLIKQGFEELGKGSKKSSFDVRWKDVEYPTLGSDEVSTGDEIKFSFRANNTYLTSKKINYSLSVIDAENNVIVNMMDSGEEVIESGEHLEKQYVLLVNEDNVKRYCFNKIQLIVSIHGSQKSIKKELPVYYDLKKQDEIQDVSLFLHTIDLPREKNLRINFGESLNNISYRIDNNMNDFLNYRLSISIHDMTTREATKIIDVAVFTGEISPYGSEITEPINFEIKEDDFKRYLSEGEIELRARVSITKDTKKYEQGKTVAKRNYKLFLNKDNKNGSFGIPVQSFDDTEHPEKRSRCEIIGERKIIINTGHPDYNFFLEEPKFHRAYCRNELEKQILLLYLEEAKFEQFGDGFEELPPKEGAVAVIDKIEEVHYKNLI